MQVLSFNLRDDGRPHVVQISLDVLAGSIESVHEQFNSREKRWAGYLAGSLTLLQDRELVDLHHPSIRGMNLALLSKVPLGAGVSSSAAIEVAAMINVMDHLQIRRNDPLLLASMCQEVENRVVGAPAESWTRSAVAPGRKAHFCEWSASRTNCCPPCGFPMGCESSESTATSNTASAAECTASLGAPPSWPIE